MSNLNIDPSFLEDMVLEHGGTLNRADGSVFNASGSPAGYRLPKRGTAKAETASQPLPAPAADSSALANVLADLVSKIQPQQQVAPVVNVPEPTVVFQPAAKVSWRFEFERNPDKTLKAITATPT